MKLRLLCCLPVLAVFVLVSAASVFAASASNNLTVQANVKANCTIGAGTINFGDYDPAVANAAVPLDGDTTFTIRCTKGTAATIELGPGGSHDGSTRRMSGGGDFLAYELYRVAGRAAA